MWKRIILPILLFFLVLTPVEVTVAEAAPTVHIVQPGDSLYKISLQYKVGISEIYAANPQLKTAQYIYPGQRITIPAVTAQKSVEEQVIALVNQERTKRGLPALKANWQLSRVARFKSEDMRDRNYFSHTSPTYGSPFNMMRAFGITYTAAGENIAAGQTSAASVMQSWMNSPGHRQNILSPQFTQIGVGYASGGSYRHYWTQMFIR